MRLYKNGREIKTDSSYAVMYAVCIYLIYMRDKPARVFIAIGITEKLQAEILEWEKDWQVLPVRWQSGKNLHITLIPPWHESDPDTVMRLLKNSSGRLAPFEIEFTSVRFGPSPEHPRLIWTEGKPNQEILALKQMVEKATGHKSEYSKVGEEWRMHITLAKFNEQDFPTFTIKKLDQAVSWKQEVNHVHLMESHEDASGTDYTLLEEVSI